MKCKKFSQRFIDELIKNGFSLLGDAEERDLVIGSDYTRRISIDNDVYNIIIGIKHYYVFGGYFTEEDNGLFMFDFFNNDGSHNGDFYLLFDRIDKLIDMLNYFKEYYI